MVGLLLLKHIYGVSDESVSERCVHVPYLQYFTGEEFFQQISLERSDLGQWRKRLGDNLELLLAKSLRLAHEYGALRAKDLAPVTADK